MHEKMHKHNRNGRSGTGSATLRCHTVLPDTSQRPLWRGGLLNHKARARMNDNRQTHTHTKDTGRVLSDLPMRSRCRSLPRGRVPTATQRLRPGAAPWPCMRERGCRMCACFACRASCAVCVRCARARVRACVRARMLCVRSLGVLAGHICHAHRCGAAAGPGRGQQGAAPWRARVHEPHAVRAAPFASWSVRRALLTP